MPEMRKVLVHKTGWDARLGLGYKFCKGDGPDGKRWSGNDAAWMEIPEDRFQEIKARRREGYLALRDRVRSGRLPVANDSQATFKVEVERSASKE